MSKQIPIVKTFTAIILAFLIAVPGLVSAQKKKTKPKDEPNHEWDYTIARNTPNAVSPFTLSFYPFVWGPYHATYEGGGLGLSLAGNYTINEKLEAFGTFTYYYATGARNLTTFNPDAFSPNDNFEIGATWFFSNKPVNKEQAITLYSTAGYNSTTHHVTMIDLDHQQKYGIRASFGLMSLSTSSTVAPFNGYDLKDASQTDIALNEHIITNSHFGYFALGLSSEKIRDYNIHFKNGQERTLSKKVTWYADILLSPFSKYDDVSGKGEKDTAIRTYNLDKYSNKAPIGFRIGISYNNLRPFGGSHGLEFGLMPGTTAPQPYLVLKLGMAFNPSGND